jgi:hypothetical protein
MNKYEPFELYDHKLVIPKKYEDAFLDEGLELVFEISEYEYYRQILASFYWVDNWYSGQDWTIPFYKIGEYKNGKFIEIMKEELLDSKVYFTRLNSVSPKDLGECKVCDEKEAFDLINQSNRCQSVMKLSKELDKDIIVYLRPWMDMSKGYEFRIFVYEMKIVAISSNDYKICNFTKDEIIKRCLTLFNKCKFDIPLPDVCIDIFINDKSADNDKIIEFNSYGSWGNADSGLFNWKEDNALLMGAISDIEVRYFDE